MRLHHIAFALALLASSGCEGALAIEAGQTSRPPGTPDRPIIDLGDPDDPPGDPPPPPPMILDASSGGADAGPPPSGCTPQCAGRECGSDGCGGTCAPGCGGGQCGADGQCQTASALCPPSGTEGTAVGQVAADFSVPMLGGGTLSVRSLCAERSVMIYRFTESCGICRSWMNNTINSLYAEVNAQGMEMVVLVGNARRADGSYGPASEADAARIRDQYGLTMPVAYEPNNEFLWTYFRSGAGIALLMHEGNVIAAPINKASDSTIRSVAGSAP